MDRKTLKFHKVIFLVAFLVAFISWSYQIAFSIHSLNSLQEKQQRLEEAISAQVKKNTEN